MAYNCDRSERLYATLSLYKFKMNEARGRYQVEEARLRRASWPNEDEADYILFRDDGCDESSMLIV